MGMDVYGLKPRNKSGEYFRNNVWYWHPLWSYIEETFPKIASKVQHGHSNDGDGLNAQDSYKLSQLLKKKIKDGSVQAYADKYKQMQDDLRLELESKKLKLKQMSAGSSEKSYEEQARELEFDPAYWDLNYPFDVENVKEFAEFLEFSGGFQIC